MTKTNDKATVGECIHGWQDSGSRISALAKIARSPVCSSVATVSIQFCKF